MSVIKESCDVEIEKTILKLGQSQTRNNNELANVLDNINVENIVAMIVKRMEKLESDMLWNYILVGLSGNNSKMFTVILLTLKAMSEREMSTKRNIEYVTGVLMHLQKLNSNQLIEICEYCLDSFRRGDSNAESWKDLLPEIVTTLSKNASLSVNEIPMTGEEYRSSIVKTMYSMKCPENSLATLAGMFKELYITAEERNTILVKMCQCLHKLNPLQLPSLAFQLFTLCNTVQLLLTPIMAFQRYFYKHYYRKLYADMHSDTTDFDSIDNHSDKEYREAEETILYHLANHTEYSITEQEIVNVFKGLAAIPQFILTPFLVSSILIMSNTNRYPETSSLAASQILPFLRNIIKCNEDEKEMGYESAWCRDTNDMEYVDINQLLAVLIDQNKDGGDVVTPGIVSLAFILLKAKHHSSVNSIGVTFLQKFLKNRFIFGQGLVKQLSEFLFADPDAGQYAECLTTLSLANTLTISECVDTIKKILDYFLLINGLNAMKMMSFVFPLLKISHPIRDALIEMLRKAMYHRELSTRQMGVFGFCMLLKQLKNNNSRRATGGMTMTFSQTNIISGFSLLSQTSLGTQNPLRHLDTMTLEIIGILKKCLNQPREIKDILYEGLNRAIEFNPQIISHVLQYLDMHFRSYFTIDENSFKIKFDLIVYEKLSGDIEEQDNLGELVDLIGKAIYLCEKHSLLYDNVVMRKFMESLVDRITELTMEDLEILHSLSHKTCIIGTQFVNTIEALMAYCTWMTKTDNDLLKKISTLFKFYSEISDEMKAKAPAKKLVKKPKRNTTQSQNPTQVTQPTQNLPMRLRPVTFKPVSILTLSTLERLLSIIHDDNVTFVTPNQSHSLRTNRDFSRYILKTTIQRIQELRNQPEYRHVKHSRRIFLMLSDISSILFQKCIARLVDLCMNFDPLTGQYSVECFKEVLFTADLLYKRKINDWLKKTVAVKSENLSENCHKIIEVIQELLDKSAEENSSIDDELNGEKIPPILLECLEILYSYIPGSSEYADKSYKWLWNYCQNNKIESKSMVLIHKLLFTQRVKTHTGLFFNTIASQIQNETGSIDDSTADLEFTLKSINIVTLESTTLYLGGILKKQLDDVEHFINKAKGFYAKVKIIGQSDTDEYLQSLKTTEKSICSQLIHIVKTLVPLSNAQLPLGACTNVTIRLMTHLYNCMTSLVRHLIQRHSTIPVSIRSLKLDQLIKLAGKNLCTKVYNMITYIEENILQDENANKKKKDVAQSNKSKVVSGTKFIPRLILCLENFNKFVIILSKKTKHDLSSCLHIGTVRDFRIKTGDLKEIITANVPEDTNDDESTNKDNDLEEDDDVYPDEEAPIDVNSILNSISGNNEESNAPKTVRIRKNKKKVLENLKEINKSTKNQSKTNESEVEVVAIPHVIPKKTRKRKKIASELYAPLEVSEEGESGSGPSKPRSTKRPKK